MKVLITGITGFVGSHLAEYCLSKPDIKVYGTMISHHLGDEEFKRIKHIKDEIELLESDLTNRVAVARVIEKTKPDKIFHLAAQAFVPPSWKAPEYTLMNNIMCELNIFEVAKEMKLDPVIQIAGSSEEYGLIHENELPVKEDNPLRPLSPYGVSKVTQDKLAFQYHKSYGLKTIITRAFNHEGPKRGEQFMTSNFAKQIVEIEKKKKESIIYVGNLEAKRDYSDVRDIVRAYWLATEKCRHGESYNICSEKARTIKSVLDLLLRLSKVKNIRVEQDPTRMRPSDVPIVWGDCSKFKKETGWDQKISFEKTMEDTLDYWRKEIKE